MEHAAGCLYLDEPYEVTRFSDAFQDAQTKALDPDESADFISEFAGAL